MADRIEGRVARILTERELVINRGSDQGVQVGMRFAVLNRKGADIVDPETGDALGSVELPKTFVKVVQVHPRLCIARTFRTWRTGGIGLMASVLQPAKVHVETLKTSESRAVEELDERDSLVKVGDPAVQVVGDESVGAVEDPE